MIEQEGRSDRIFLTGVVAAGLALRLFHLSLHGFLPDEAVLWYGCLNPTEAFGSAQLAVWIFGSFMALFKNRGELIFHLPAVLFGALCIPAAYRLARVVAGRSTARIAAVLTALSPIALNYSQEARPYSLLMFLSTLFLAEVIIYVERPTRSIFFRVLVLGSLLFLSHRLSVAIIVPTFVFLICRFVRAWHRALILMLAFGYVLFRIVPTIPEPMNGLYRCQNSFFLHTVAMTLGPVLLYPTKISLWDMLAAVFLALAVIGAFRLKEKGNSWIVLFFLIMFLVTFAGLYATLGIRGTWPWARYMIHLVIPYLVLIAAGCHQLMGRRRGVPVLFAGMMMAPGAIKWAAHLAQEVDPREHAIASALVRNMAEFNGVILDSTYKVNMPLRTVVTFWVYRRDTLPVYIRQNDTYIRVNAIPDRLGLGTIPILADQVTTLFPSGDYVFFYDRRTNVECSQLRTLDGVVWTAVSVPTSYPFKVCRINE